MLYINIMSLLGQLQFKTVYIYLIYTYTETQLHKHTMFSYNIFFPNQL